MRKELNGLICALAIASAMATYGCGGSGGGGNGGSTSGGAGSGGTRTGGNTSGGAGSGGATSSGGSAGTTTQPANCPNGTSCSGSVVGTWDVTSSCLTLSGDMDVSILGMGCSTVPVTGSLEVTGTWTANSDGTYADKTVTKGSIKFPLSKACLTVSSVVTECTKLASLFPILGWTSATSCSTTNGECSCTAPANQTGGIGVISMNPATTGKYKASGGDLTTDEAVDYASCVSDTKLTLTPKPTILPVTGTVVLQKSGSSPGTGGAGSGGATTGSGGSGGSGGITGSGGATTGSGGKTGGGGATATGGTGTGSGGKTGAGGATATGGNTSVGTGNLPCDIYAAANNTCVAAHSTVRLLLSSYAGPLYQVKKADGTTKDIGFLTPGGLADSAAQDAFCTSACTITKVYDQSGHGNFVAAQTPDTTDMSPAGHSGMTAASATKDPTNVGGHRVYSLYTNTSQAYWHDGSKSGMPLGKEPQGIYMVTSGTHVNTGCCYDYGNGETSRTYVAGPSMDSIYFGSCTQWAHGAGSGPWIMADMEDGMVIGNTSTPSITYKFVTAIEKNNGTSEWSLRGGDATTGNLSTLYKGALPGGKNPMKKQGSVVLGAGGDCCYSNNNGSAGTFYEGAIVSGYPSDATEDAIQANIVSAGYGK